VVLGVWGGLVGCCGVSLLVLGIGVLVLGCVVLGGRGDLGCDWELIGGVCEVGG
jgi:hypothetical protein